MFETMDDGIHVLLGKKKLITKRMFKYKRSCLLFNVNYIKLNKKYKTYKYLFFLNVYLHNCMYKKDIANIFFNIYIYTFFINTYLHNCTYTGLHTCYNHYFILYTILHV